MKQLKFIPLVLALGLIFTGCSSDTTDTNSNGNSEDSSTSQEEGNSLENLFGGDGSSLADEMRLENYSGNITLQNQNEEKVVVLGSRLVTGDNIETMIESNAYVVLDRSKVLRVNETSQVEIIQEDKHLDIHLTKGTVFFNVTSALAQDESLEFHTSNAVTGVRGTSGIIHYDPATEITQIVVLTGVVSGATTSDGPNDEQNIEAGQIAIVETLPDGTVEMTIYELEEDDPFYYFSDTFIDDIQGDLDGEGESVPLSDMVREPEFFAYEAMYAAPIAEYRDYLFDPTYMPNSDEGNHAIYWMNFNWMKGESNTFSRLKMGYEFYDLDGNSIPELILYEIGTTGDAYIKEVWTMQEGVPVSILQCDAVSTIVLYEEGGASIFYRGNVDYKHLDDFYAEYVYDVNYAEVDTPLPQPIVELTLITADTGRSSLEETGNHLLVQALKDAITLRMASMDASGEDCYLDFSELTMLTDIEIESLALHTTEAFAGQRNVAVKTRGELLAEGHEFYYSTGERGDTAPFLVDGFYLCPEISRYPSTEFSINFPGYIYSATLNSLTDRYDVSLASAAG